ncbi:PREDICTED: cytochrome P450 4c3-like isoform X2 [Dinoponera quadriceps]|uniref:Cytochrome P450 4c3-like isoform X2 n=1 Tax=Dinoponera quadriceps TaxID=609295 RepID=A0A6P3XRN1_DINQU|nr:PREDICTED: cytochrome P450 4c3-like isoform X2 [Dinoponera quadriceps]
MQKDINSNNLLIFITEPDHIKTILQSSSCLNKAIMYKPFKNVLGTGVFTAPASIWVGHRKIIASSFNTNILRIFCDTFVEEASILMDKLGHLVGDEVDLFDYILLCTLDIICGTSLGIKMEYQSNKNRLLIEALQRTKEIIISRIRNVFLFSDIIFNLTPLCREQQKHVNYGNSVTGKIIQQKEEARNNLDVTKSECAKPSRKVFLDILMEASNEGKKFTRKGIIDEVNTLTAAGSDSTAITMNFTIFMIANFPEIQKKVYDELLEIYGTQDPKSAPVKFDDLQYMNYLECVIKETLRVFPTVPIVGRRLTEDLILGGHTLPQGADAIITTLALHRNEKYWPNALTFDPDRFLPENMTNIHPYSYIPFSNGPRNCIGVRYAMASMKIIIATLLRTYTLKVDKKMEIDQIEVHMDIMLAPLHPLKVRIEKRSFDCTTMPT